MFFNRSSISIYIVAITCTLAYRAHCVERGQSHEPHQSCLSCKLGFWSDWTWLFRQGLQSLLFALPTKWIDSSTHKMESYFLSCCRNRSASLNSSACGIARTASWHRRKWLTQSGQSCSSHSTLSVCKLVCSVPWICYVWRHAFRRWEAWSWCHRILICRHEWE